MFYAVFSHICWKEKLSCSNLPLWTFMPSVRMTYSRRSAEKYFSVIYFIAINCPQSFQDGIVRELDALNSIFKVPWILLRELYWVPPHILISITSPSLSSSFKLQWNAFGFISTCSLSLQHTFASSTHAVWSSTSHYFHITELLEAKNH